ncbi:MAG: hypothetical protein K6A36_07115, partial [Paludibacteraceae bacterium]|nr:hypothetical protein [Paludibacteraceae bacterium]
HKAIEGKINMKQFPVPVQSLKAGIVCSTIEWAELGILPQVTINQDGTDSMSELVEIPLPAENEK